MSGAIQNAGVVYGTRGEIFDSNGEHSVEEFVKQTFGIDKVFENKLVMGRCICHGKKDLETDLLLSNSAETENFMFSKESTKPHIVLIYDKPGLNQESNDSKSENDVVVSAKQWEKLVASVEKLQLSVETQRTAPAKPTPVPEPVQEEVKKYSGPVHEGIVCDVCYPLNYSTNTIVKPILGPRFKCLDCVNFDLCSSCEAKGVENDSHKRHHNMAKINTPLKKGVNYNMTGLSSMALNDKEIIVDIPEREKDIFQMFSSVEAVREVIHGYKAYCLNQSRTSTINSKPKFRSKLTPLEVTTTRRDNLLTFSVFNNGKRTLPGGCTLIITVFYPSSHDSKSLIECHLGPHELKPGNKKLFHKQVSSNFQENKATVEISNGVILYSGSSPWLLDNRIELKPTTTSSSPPTLQNDAGYKPLSLSAKEDEGVISSSMTNDEYSLCSESSSESDWGDYDFLSEEDI